MKKSRVAFLRPHTHIDEAESLRRADDPRDFAQAVLSEKEFMGIKVPKRRFILERFMVEESITIINGYRGFGKSWFIMAIANEVTWGGSVGPWKVEKSMNTLIVDGEMPMSMLQERLELMNRGRNIDKKPAELSIYPEAYAYRIGLHRANILDKRWRKQASRIIEDLDIGLLILDNLSSLAPGIDENEKTAFDPVNRWLLELRFMKRTIIMTHHTGKSGEQRGTSAHEDHVDTAVLIGKPPGWRKDEGCKFTVSATKDRDFVMKGESSTLVLEEDRNGRLGFSIAVEKGLPAAMRLLRDNPDMEWKDAKKLGVAQKTFYRAKEKMRENA